MILGSREANLPRPPRAAPISFSWSMTHPIPRSQSSQSHWFWAYGESWRHVHRSIGF